MLNKYNKILKKINIKYLHLFLEFTKDFYNSWDNFIYEIFDILSTTKFKNLNLNKHIKILFFSQPECWLFFIEDKDFIEYVKKLRSSMQILYYENNKEFENFRQVMRILNENHKDLFDL